CGLPKPWTWATPSPLTRAVAVWSRSTDFETSRSCALPGAKRGSFAARRTRASQGSWSSPIRTRSAAALSFSNCPGVTSTACGSCAAGAHHRPVEVLVEAQHDPVRLRLHARPVELQVLAHDELHHDLAVGALERGEVDLAIALAAVGIARPDEAALEEDRDVDRRALLKLVDVHVRAVLPGPERRHRRHRIGRAALARR